MRYKELSDEQIKYIIDNYEKLSYSEIAKNINISKSKIVAQAIQLQKDGFLKSKQKRRTWTFEEEEQLINLLELNIDDIAIKMNKKPESIISKLKQLRSLGKIKKDFQIKYKPDSSNFKTEITSWTKEDIEKLVYNVKTMGLVKLANSLNKGTFDTIMKVYELKETNLIKETYWNTKDYSEWSKEDDLFLVEHFERSKKENIINELSIKNWKKIIGRANKFGLKRDSHGTLYESPNEKIVKGILLELDIEFIEQKRIDYNKNKFFIVDFLIKDTNIVLEAQGDYWHGNPKKFPNPNKTQLEKIAADKNRKSILESLNYQVVYLWEYDLIHNYQECVKLIKKLCLLNKKTP